MGKGDIKTRKGKLFRGTYGVRRRPKRHKSAKAENKNECTYCGVKLLKKKKALQEEKNTKRYPDNGITKDHVPQKCLFEGYPPGYKVNRITVPSCHKCNREFSEVENELRDLIGISNDKDELQKGLTTKSVRAILSKPNSQERLVKDSKGKVRGVVFDKDTLLPSHLKNFKGIFYEEFKTRITESFKIFVLDTKSKSNFEELMVDFIDKNCNWHESGHRDIFQYKISLIKPAAKGELVKTDSINEAVGVVCRIQYHKKFEILILATRKRILKKRIH